MSAKLLKGRYTATYRSNHSFVGEVRYLDPNTGQLYEDANGEIYANSGFRDVGNGLWTNGSWDFGIEKVAVEPAKALLGFAISSSKGAPTVLHSTQKIAEAEAEALRLAQGNTGVEFTVFPVYRGKAVAKAYTPKPVAKLEKL